MKSLREYIAESENWFDSPAAGDDFAINIREECLLESYVIQADSDTVVLAADDQLMGYLQHYGMLAEDQVVTEGVMSEIDIDLQSLANRGDEEDLIAALEGDLGPGTAMVLQNMMEELKDELAAKGMNDVMNDQDKMIEILWDKIVDEYGGRDLDEAEYQGRDVPLGKPMRGDVKKFKVYVKDPKTGNVKKVNFGDKSMRIKKSNPARRKSFRARHNCANPGPRTKARYWSCRKW